MDKEVSLELTPTWALVTVVVVMVSLGFFFQGSLKQLAKWLDRTKRKALLSALDKIKEELMVFGLLSLLMGHWIVFVAKICVKTSTLNSTFYPCAVKKNNLTPGQHVLSSVKYPNDSFVKELVHKQKNEYCPELCFSRQFWSSINQADYMALRLGFISKHQLPLTYDFHNYMLRSMEEEFRDIVGISAPLWIYGICCIFLEFHGTDLYFWLSFLPAILILLIGTKLHRVVVKLAVEIMNSFRRLGNRQFNLRDELFWFGKPRLLLWLIQFISFQNAFEMSTFIWSLWEINGSSCFMDNETYIVIRLVCGAVTQFWFSFITFPLYIIITQMGAKFKKTVVSENVRKSLHGWQRRVKAKQSSSTSNLLALPSTTSLGSSMTDSELSRGGSSTRVEDKSAALQHQEASTSQAVTNGTSQDNETLEVSLGSGTPCYDSSSDEDDAGVHDLGH
ncbi:MLO-like protein 4 isoform X3 [Populus alba]|uniref:MLO-like protein 4 isoform X3 n=1 Tax=Populus alba TaxID=43335 RepID=UPI00158E4DBD|nr:MLO-like protein 4 isoform X2 [Populus alba]